MSKSFLHVEQIRGVPVSEWDVEVVERKGIGHPDTLIDGACEAVSRALSQEYQKECGMILHHNVDKGLIVGGRSAPRFGGGEVLEPIYVLVAGRATSSVKYEGKTLTFPVGEIALSSTKRFLQSGVRHLDVEKHTVMDYRIKVGSADLTSIFNERGDTPLSNDTSIGVGYAPMTDTERLVLETEKLLNSDSVKRRIPEIGEDIKVMGYRKGRNVNLTIAVATISSLIPDVSHYSSVIEQTKATVEDFASKFTGLNVQVNVNSGDIKARGSYYLTVTGTSAEMGDDGNTGRGNRANGLITPMRQYSMEATAGKNPVNHTGKIFNVVARDAAEKIVAEVKWVKEAYVRLLSRIGAPINQPQVASAAVVLDKSARLASVEGEIESIIQERLSNISEVTERILRGAVTLF